MAGKGSRPRKVNLKTFNDNFDHIFRKPKNKKENKSSENN